MFPLTAECFSDIKPLDEAQKAKAFAFLKKYVEDNKCYDVIIEGDSLSFKANFISMRHDKFVGTQKGIFHIMGTKISYKCYMYGMWLILVLIIMLAVFEWHHILKTIVLAVILIPGNWIYARLNGKRILNQVAEQINRL